MAETAALRRRGSIRQRGNSLQVRVYAGVDPVTGKDAYLTATIKGTDKAAQRQANDKLAEFRAQVMKQRTAPSSATLAYAIDEWLRAAELEDSTRETYRGYINRTIRPAIGAVALNKVTARVLEKLYAELRRCRVRCNGRPFIEHRAEGEHDCAKAKCAPHACRPMAASTVRQIHAIISGALNAAVRWDWLDFNPAQIAQRPKRKPPEPDPPSTADAARLIEEAFRVDQEWGTLVWLVMTSGIRRGEICALRWSRVDLDQEVVEIRSSYQLRRGVGKEKATKTHQMRRIALDSETVDNPNNPDLPFLMLDETHLVRWRGHVLTRLGDKTATDQLETALRNMPASLGRSRLSLIVDLAYAYATTDHNAALIYARQARVLARTIGSERQRQRLTNLVLDGPDLITNPYAER